MPDQFWGRKSFCLVTGASQGIGRSFAVEFARNFAPGSRIVLLARSLPGLKQTESLILAANPQVTVDVYSVDLSQPSEEVFRVALRGGAAEDSYELAMLVNNAGSIGKADQLAADMDNAEEWNRYLSLNLFHVTSLTSEFLRQFPSGSHRCVLNLTSLCAVKPFKSMGYYCVGKAAREMYFRVLAEENPTLDVLNYSPGPVDTDMVSEVISSVQNDETRHLFTSMKATNGLVTLQQTTDKVVALLASRKYETGGRFDYYDPLP